MKKFIGVIVAVMLCACLLVPTAFAADASVDSVLAELEGVDLGALNQEDLDAILGDLGLSDVELDSVIAELEGEDDNEALDTLNGIANQMNSVQAENSGDGTATAGTDLAAILEMIPVDFDITPIAEMLGGLTDGGLSSLMSSVGAIFGGNGINLASEDVGTFDIANVSKGGDTAANATNLTAGIADTLVGALETLGLDSSAIEGLLDNEIVNFFANMYIGFIGEVEESTTAAPTTTKPAVVTTTTPKTGDTSAVIVALATLTVASGAAFVCLKKKKEA
ncbi:MAG: LPXTG cell wall anchor domain-containing protein [Clostridia bacterium]|nr:LPXTG cell wall anchor domain-containing protein [Clostridia bacterium]